MAGGTSLGEGAVGEGGGATVESESGGFSKICRHAARKAARAAQRIAKRGEWARLETADKTSALKPTIKVKFARLRSSDIVGDVQLTDENVFISQAALETAGWPTPLTGNFWIYRYPFGEERGYRIIETPEPIRAFGATIRYRCIVRGA